MSRDEILDAAYALAFRADYSARYHRRRSAFLTRLDKLLTLLILVSGASAFMALVDVGPDLVGQVAAAAVAVIAILQVIFEFGIWGARHSDWLRRWERLSAEIDCAPVPTAADIRRWRQVRADLETECVGELRALAVDCENAARQVRGVSEGQRMVKPLQRLLIHLGTYQQDFPQIPSDKLRLSPPDRPAAK